MESRRVQETKMILKGVLLVSLFAFAWARPEFENFFRTEEAELGFLDEENLNYSGEAESATEPPKGCSAATHRNTDGYIDRVLSETRPKIPDPAFLPDRIGRLTLYNGTLANLPSSLRRSGAALVRCSDDAVSFLVPVALSNLTGRYFWETDVPRMPVFKGLVDVFVGDVEADVLYTRLRETNRAEVEEFKITRLEGVKVRFDGLGPANRLASRLADLAAKYFGKGVARVLEGPVKSAINRELRNVEKYEKYYF